MHLTPIEYKLLCLLCKNVGRVLTHTFITQHIWGRSRDNDVASLRVHMATLPSFALSGKFPSRIIISSLPDFLDQKSNTRLQTDFIRINMKSLKHSFDALLKAAIQKCNVIQRLPLRKQCLPGTEGGKPERYLFSSTHAL